ncbi:protein tyrosine phosphatase [Methylobacterium variabile]|jgi:predicted protein tyrosine phosphatase|uniref:Protein tyrosine phosphatase n=1 Tax=Methylobacterium variabile TaxID=298794 RepID=A0A0J6T941_9HYPH|nr:protein-tyrosine phosphatase family protein [Methylobacterium variabile]KMO42038.1 protein tyrosine phosphatase [Methylobacterium variabile]
MPRLHVCALSRLPETVETSGARHVVTLINVGTPVTRPPSISETDHLFVGVSDITDALDGHVLPDEEHVRRLLAFVRAWDRAQPLVIHCYAGISRSTAAAFITACALRPDRDEAEIARELREASPSATPNRRLVAVADAMLGRDGRMVAAAAAIGRGADAFEGEPFCLAID